MLRTADQPTCHFVITLTTHTPYQQLTGGPDYPYPHPTTTSERFLNNMRYLDNCLRDYITSLGKGVTVLLYADHPTEQFEGYVADRDVHQNHEYVPVFIYDTDQDLAKLQKTRNDPQATDGMLKLLDVINYVRGQVKRQCEPSVAQPAAEQLP